MQQLLCSVALHSLAHELRGSATHMNVAMTETGHGVREREKMDKQIERHTLI